MLISGIGAISDFVKNNELKQKWNLRAKYTLRKEDEDPQIANFRQQVDDARKHQERSMIETKLKTGARLSSTEMEYLRKNAPELFKKATEIEKERAAYRRELERCRTKEEARQLNFRRLQTFQAQASAISGNANIPADKKAEALETISMRAMSAAEEHARFSESAAYSFLPENNRTASKTKRAGIPALYLKRE